MMTDLLTAQRFLDLFSPYLGAYGAYNNIREDREDGKKLGDRYTERKPLTVELIRRHLDGTFGVGAIMIREDNTARFGVIDVDDYTGISHHTLAQKVRNLNLPLVVCQSKSGGAHLYCFATVPIPAAKMVLKLKEIASLLGFGGVEIFPKQSKVLWDQGDLGSWINLPYFKGVEGGRFAIDPDTGDAVDFEDFFLFVAKLEQEPAWFDRAIVTSIDMPQGPPCLQHLIQLGFPPGTRNNGLVNLAVYAKKTDPENWPALVEEMNRKYMNPPLSSEEVVAVIRSGKKKDYGYKCNDQPICSHCNSSVCRTRKYGVGRAGALLPEFGQLSKMATEPPTYFWEVNGKRIALQPEELLDLNRFKSRVMVELDFIPPNLKRDDWESIVTEKLATIQIIPAPPEATIAGQVFELLERFCNGRVRGILHDELLQGRVIHEEGRHYFRTVDLKQFLDTQKVKIADSKLFTVLSDLGAEYGQWSIKGRSARWCSVPEFPAQTKPFDIPQGIMKDEAPF
jgi:hypothetical protein